MVPAVIPMLLMMIPAMLAALSVVREKELGSIINLYVTPVTRSEFLLGKQLPYVVLAMINYLPVSYTHLTRRCRWRRTCNSLAACSATTPPSAVSGSTS